MVANNAYGCVMVEQHSNIKKQEIFVLYIFDNSLFKILEFHLHKDLILNYIIQLCSHKITLYYTNTHSH